MGHLGQSQLTTAASKQRSFNAQCTRGDLNERGCTVLRSSLDCDRAE
jgi:hypothetical protein